jgi:hypothetical protein
MFVLEFSYRKGATRSAFIPLGCCGCPFIIVLKIFGFVSKETVELLSH